ncbi:MAG: GDP-L-fucose synthase [Pseudomonadota bacterium]
MAEIADNFQLSGKRIFVAGHRGLVGSALVRRLQSENCEIITAGKSELDLRRQDAVEWFINNNQLDAVIVAAAKVGGILANSTYPVDFLYDNLMIEANLISAAYLAGVSKLLFLGSSCIYPRLATQPMREEVLLTGPLEPNNEWYAMAKIAGIKLCQAYRLQYGANFISAMPTNLYGPYDNFDLASSHVLPALLRKIHQAKEERQDEVVVWGTGKPRREFLHVDDVADALVFLLRNYDGLEHINVGTGEDVSIEELALIIAQVVGFKGQVKYDTSKPDGTPRKLLDVSRMSGLGWKAQIALPDGIEQTYRWFLDNQDTLRQS